MRYVFMILNVVINKEMSLYGNVSDVVGYDTGYNGCCGRKITNNLVDSQIFRKLIHKAIIYL